MRTNIDIDDDVLDAAMKSGAYKTKKDAVEAGLRLIARQAAYREILRWEGKLQWDGDADEPAPPSTLPSTPPSTPPPGARPLVELPAPAVQLQEPAAPAWPAGSPIATPAAGPVARPTKARRHVGG